MRTMCSLRRTQYVLVTFDIVCFVYLPPVLNGCTHHKLCQVYTKYYFKQSPRFEFERELEPKQGGVSCIGRRYSRGGILD